MAEWISVEDKLPAKETKVIVYSCNRYINSTWYNGSSFGDGRGLIRDVTHWMPLPEPPKT